MLSKPFARFVFVGLFVLAVENLTIWCLMQLLDNYLIARTLSTLLAILQSYILNTRYSFSSTHNAKRFFSYLSGVVLSIGVTYFVSLGLYYLVFSSSCPLLATNVGAVAAALANFYFQRNITYKRVV